LRLFVDTSVWSLLAELCIRRELTMLSTDRDFERIARHTTLDLWHSSSS